MCAAGALQVSNLCRLQLLSSLAGALLDRFVLAAAVLQFGNSSQDFKVDGQEAVLLKES